MRRLGLIHHLAVGLFLFSLMNSIGTQWALFQGVAWVKMAFQYGQEFGIQKGLARAFDGDHPCGMCHEIRRQRDSNQDQTPILLAQIKSDAFFAGALISVEGRVGPERVRYAFDPPRIILTRSVTPSVPPPEAA